MAFVIFEYFFCTILGNFGIFVNFVIDEYFFGTILGNLGISLKPTVCSESPKKCFLASEMKKKDKFKKLSSYQRLRFR